MDLIPGYEEFLKKAVVEQKLDEAAHERMSTERWAPSAIYSWNITLGLLFPFKFTWCHNNNIQG